MRNVFKAAIVAAAALTAVPALADGERESTLGVFHADSIAQSQAIQPATAERPSVFDDVATAATDAANGFTKLFEANDDERSFKRYDLRSQP